MQRADRTWTSSRGAPKLPAGVRRIAGRLSGAGVRIGVVVSRYNARYTAELLRSAVRELGRLGVRAGDITVVEVPGAFEIPSAAAELAQHHPVEAIIALGCVIQGETPHASLINRTVALRLSELSQRHRLPIVDAVVPVLSEEQARARCAPGPDNRGSYAARVAVEMARLFERLRAGRP
ncbi:MAG: 6,7-dimethyl-8-ribityllumazine synthase [Kiritimatiellae bacterium]|nr:6,7-dimethyl-8-ribityllumazine synthase [Kiritimatiellia bacterium]